MVDEDYFFGGMRSVNRESSIVNGFHVNRQSSSVNDELVVYIYQEASNENSYT